MKARIVRMNKQLATEILKRNVANRNIKPLKYRLIEMMKSGYWVENGESIIIDSNGVLTDGQHRLMACIEADYEFDCVLVTDVNPKAMESVDSGTNRSLSDVFKIRNIQNASNIAALTAKIIRHNRNIKQQKISAISDAGSKNSPLLYINHQEGLSFAEEHITELTNIFNISIKIYSAQTIKYFSASEIGYYLFALSDSLIIKNDVIEYMKEITGINNGLNITRWLYNTLIRSKLEKKKLTTVWKNNAIVRVYALFRVKSSASYTRVDVDSLVYINDFSSRTGRLK